MDKDNISDGLFTVDCSKCGQTFPAENSQCFCGNKMGELKLNVDEMLNRIYNSEDKMMGMDIVYDVFWNLANKFDIMNEIMGKADPTKLDTSVTISFLTCTFKYSKKVSNHLVFWNKANDFLKTKFSEEKVKRLIGDFIDDQDYWEDMKELGAPEWLTGPKP